MAAPGWDNVNYGWQRWVLGYQSQQQLEFLQRWLGRGSMPSHRSSVWSAAVACCLVCSRSGCSNLGRRERDVQRLFRRSRRCWRAMVFRGIPAKARDYAAKGRPAVT